MRKLADAWDQLAKRPFICTEAAYQSQEIVGGTIFGYHCEDNPTAELGKSEGGHDFLIVEKRYILDFWAAAYYGHKPIFDLQADAQEILKLYGPRECWTRATSKEIKEGLTDMYIELLRKMEP